MDLSDPWSPLGIAIARLGYLVIADHLGEPTSVPFGLRCPEVVDLGRTVGSPCPPGGVVHFTAVYDLLVAARVAAVLIVLRRWPLRLGTCTLLLGVLYGAGRFGFDFLRADTRGLGLTASQWTALALIVLAGALLARGRRSDLPREATARPAIPAADREHPEVGP